MKHLILALAILTAAACLSAQGVTVQTPVGNFSMQLQGVDPYGATTSGYLMEEIAARLDILQKSYLVKLKKADARKANQLIEEIYYLLSLLPEDDGITLEEFSTQTSSSVSNSSSSANSSININIINNNQQTPPPPVVTPPPVIVTPPPPVIITDPRQPMPDPDFSDFLSTIKRQSFSDDKLRVLRTVAQDYRFNTGQIQRLLDSFTFSDDKLEALRLSWPGCVDPQNKFRILNSFTYSIDKEEAEQIMSRP